MSWSGKDKSRFRQRKIWKDFRKQIIAERKCCQFCGSKYRMNLHHMDKNPDNYTNLNPNHFLLLCNSCHDYWETKWSIKDKSKFIQPLLDVVNQFTISSETANDDCKHI